MHFHSVYFLLQLVIHVGVSSYTAEFKLEKQAHRIGYKSADCTGNFECTGSVCCSGEDCIFTGFNIEELCKQINAMGVVKASPSKDAGRYMFLQRH